MGRAAALALALLASLVLAPAQALAAEPRPLDGEASEANIQGGRHRLNREFPQALEAFNRVIKLAPDSHLGWYNRAMVRRDLGDCRKAIPDFNQALRRTPNFFGGLYNRGNCRQALGDFRAAIADYTRAIDLPGRIDGRFLAHFARGDARRRAGELQPALEDYSRVSEMRTDTAVLRSRAWVHLYLGDWAAARDDAVRFVEVGGGKEPGSAYAVLVAFIAFNRLGEAARAQAFMSEWAGELDAAAWPAPAMRHLRGVLGERELLAAASNGGERMEARAYAGVGRLLAGARAEGVALLKEVLRTGDPRYWEYDLAYYELRRLGEAAQRGARHRK